MYQNLFQPPAVRIGTGSAIQHTTRKSLERRRKMQNAIQQEFLERQRKQNAIILSPTESRQGMYQQMFSPVLTNLDSQGRAMGLRAKPSKADVKSTKSSEYKQQQKQSRQQKASEVMEAFGNTKSNNTKGHNKILIFHINSLIKRRKLVEIIILKDVRMEEYYMTMNS